MPDMVDPRGRTLRQVVIPGGGGGGGDIPTGTWAEDAGVNDELKFLFVTSPEDADVSDSLADLGLGLTEDASVNDEFSAIVEANFTEDVSVNDTLRLVLTDVFSTRVDGGTHIVDAWTDQAATAVNHGNENILVKGKASVGNDERRGHILIDLREFQEFTVGGTGLTLELRVSVSGLVQAALTWNAKTYSTAPFTESGLTWANQPTNDGTSGTGTLTVATGAAQVFTITITPGNLDLATYPWLLFTFTAATSAVPPTFTILSRETASANVSGPNYTLDYLQKGS